MRMLFPILTLLLAAPAGAEITLDGQTNTLRSNILAVSEVVQDLIIAGFGGLTTWLVGKTALTHRFDVERYAMGVLGLACISMANTCVVMISGDARVANERLDRVATESRNYAQMKARFPEMQSAAGARSGGGDPGTNPNVPGQQLPDVCVRDPLNCHYDPDRQVLYATRPDGSRIDMQVNRRAATQMGLRRRVVDPPGLVLPPAFRGCRAAANCYATDDYRNRNVRIQAIDGQGRTVNHWIPRDVGVQHGMVPQRPDPAGGPGTST